MPIAIGGAQPAVPVVPPPSAAQKSAVAAEPGEPMVGLGTLLDAEDLEGALEGIGIRPAGGDEPSEDGFDLAAELSDGVSSSASLQDVFRAFKKGIEAQIGDGSRVEIKPGVPALARALAHSDAEVREALEKQSE